MFTSRLTVGLVCTCLMSLCSRLVIVAAVLGSWLLGDGLQRVFAHAAHVETEKIQLRAPHPDQVTLEAAFAQAAAQYQVPVEILRAVGFAESRWVHTGPTVDYGYGIMHLVNNSDAVTLSEAAELTGRSVEDVKLDPIANIQGGAALIAHYVKKTVGTANTWQDYWEALKRFSGLNESVQEMQALEYFTVLANGASGTNELGMDIQLAPVSGLDLAATRAQMQVDQVASDDYGPAIWNPAASCNYQTTRLASIDTWINHWIGSGTYAGTISWFKNCAASTSSHFVIRQSDGEITQMVRIAHKAWTTGYMNSRSIGVEHEATPSYPWPQNSNAPILVASSACCRHFCNVYGIPKTRTYITGHSDYYSTACPGNFPWTVYLDLVNGVVPYTNPPYLFGGGNDGWSAGQSATGIAWTGSSSWGGSIYFDQNGNDCYIYSPTTNFAGGSGPQVMNVDLYPQSGTTAAHDMQLHWKTNAANSFTADKASPIVNYTAQNAWATVNLSMNSSNWWGQTVNQLRLDFDQINHGTRFIINHIVLQDGLWWHFSSDVMGWSIGRSLTGLTQTSCCGWPGIMYADQNGDDANLYSPTLSGGGWPFNYIGGVNDWIKVRVYPENGNTNVHDMAVYWITSGDGTWNEAKSTHVTYTGQNQWVDVNLPVGLNSNWPADHITRLRLDFDQVNHGTRWLVDSISSEHVGADTTAPSVPTNLVATANGTGQINLTWSASTDARGVNGYRIYRNNTQIATSVAPSYTDSSGAPATTYTYEVAAYDASGNVSGKSNSDSATTSVGDTLPPSAPQNLAGNATGPTSVHLTWDASTDNVAVTGYEIRRNGTAIGSSATTSYTDGSATQGTTYTYEVRAKDSVPNYSDWSDPAEVTTPYAPPVSTVVFSDGFNGNLNNWTTGVSAYAYSTTVNHGTFTGGGAAYMAASQTSQMFHGFARPFAQGKAKGYYWDGKGGWQTGVCGWAYRQSFSLRDFDGAAKMYIDNEFYSASDNTKYFYRLVGAGSGGAHTAYATRDPATDCNGTWVAFETTVTPGAPNASPTGTFITKVTDRAGATSTTQNLSADYFAWGFARITLGLGNSSANECYWDDISLEATPPGVPTMTAPTVLSDTQIRWNFTPADNNQFGWDLMDSGGTVLSPNWPSAGWLDHNASSWTQSGLTANSTYGRKVKTWNGTLNSHDSNVVSARTLSPAPGAGSITPDNASPCAFDDVNWTAVGGFGGAGKVEYYAYAWDTNPTYSFIGDEPTWDSGTLALVPTTPETWYLHVKGYNADDVANGTYNYGVAAGTCATPPAAIVAVSRKTQGGGPFDIDVAVPTAVECRGGGPTQVVVTFDAAIEGLGGLDNADVSVSSGSVNGVSITGPELTVTLSSVADAGKLVMTFPGIVAVGGNTAGSSTVCFGVMTGDATGDGTTDVFDLVTIRNNLNAAANASNFRSDVTADGSINIFDLVLARNNLNLSISGSCP